MIKLNFICRFKSDIVLHSSSNTEGKIEKFDYIAGSNFLGMVAQKYPEFGKDAFEVFHSGDVRFLDAHIMENGQQTFHAPFSWFAPKGYSLEKAIKSKEIYNEHFITTEKYDAFIDKGIQLKQQRAGFITSNGDVAKIKHNYRQKSSYDKKNRRSKEGAMFGYYALPKGTEWSFSVEIESEKHKDKIINILEKSSRLGKSRASEYGRIEIEFIDEEREPKEFIAQKLKPLQIEDRYFIFLYAHSRLALTNQGVNSYQPDLASLGLDNNKAIKIDWDKSQIRTARYTPYVTIRSNRDPERLIIDKGSIIAVEVNKEFDVSEYAKNISKGIGLYLSEGHGRVVVNPTFLMSEIPEFESIQTDNPKREGSSLQYGKVNSWLQEQQKKERENYELLKDIKEFIQEYQRYIKNKKSQWGQVRSLCSAYTNDEKLYEALFSEEIVNNHKRGFLVHGLAEKKWDSKLIDALKEEKANRKNYREFIKLLSIYAPKEDSKKGAN